MAAHYLTALARFADFDGRASRAELWGFVGVHVAVTLALVAVSAVVGTVLEVGWVAGSLVLALYLALTFFPLLSAVARRLHDTGRSGWWQLLYFLPLVGALVLLVLSVLPSERIKNVYGPPPGGTPAPAPSRSLEKYMPEKREIDFVDTADAIRDLRHSRMPT